MAGSGVQAPPAACLASPTHALCCLTASSLATSHAIPGSQFLQEPSWIHGSRVYQSHPEPVVLGSLRESSWVSGSVNTSWSPGRTLTPEASLAGSLAPRAIHNLAGSLLPRATQSYAEAPFPLLPAYLQPRLITVFFGAKAMVDS